MTYWYSFNFLRIHEKEFNFDSMDDTTDDVSDASISNLPEAEDDLFKENDIDAPQKLNIGKIVDETCTNEDEMENRSEDISKTLSNIGKRVDKPVGSFVCQYCHISFSNVITWKQHENTHTSNLKCGLCDETFQTAKLLLKHETSKHTAVVPELDEDDEVHMNARRGFQKKKHLVTEIKVF